MGIQGLIQFLDKASSQITLEDIRGSTVAIDSYCWLHKGAFGCADQLSRGEDTDKYVFYCLKYVNLLLSYDIKPILVFDGRHLPAKALTEKRRRESRDQSRKLAAELLRLGEIEKARSHMRRCIDITHEMAHRLILECRKKNVDCIVAPYEADAQLAYLNRRNIAQFVITEDSDLVLFGCSKVIFKLDMNGNGLMVDTEKLYLAMGCRKDRYTFDKFRNMCILSGCDYLDSLPGIGLAKACKFFCRTEETDMRRALPKVPSYLNMKNLVVPIDYIENFLKADATFRYMYVFDPFKRTMVRLNELPDDFDISHCSNAGTICDNETAMQLALGNLNPFTMKKLDDWNPDVDVQGNKSNSMSISWSNQRAKHKSIWKSDFIVHNPGRSNSVNNETGYALEFKRYILKTVDSDCEPVEVEQTEKEILSFYATQDEPRSKRQCTDSETTPPNTRTSSPSASKPRNPFLKTNSTLATNQDNTTNSLLETLSPRKSDSNEKSQPPRLSSFDRTVISSERKVLSRFFKPSPIVEKMTTINENLGSQGSSSSSDDANQDIYAETITDSQKSEEKQRQEATLLYLSSPEASLSDRGDRTPPTVTPTYEISGLQALDSGIDISSNEKDDIRTDESSNLPKELLEKFEFKVQTNNLKVLSDDVTIVISDEDTTRKVEIPIKKSKPIVRRIGLARPKPKMSQTLDATQSKLSKFFYKKKP